MEPSREQIDALVDWVTSQGGYIHPSVEIYRDAVTGLSFRVRSDAPSIAPWETIVRLPSRLSLSFLNALETPLFEEGGGGGDVLSKVQPHVAGRLLLIREYLRGAASFWHPYITCLPQPADVEKWALPAFWGKDEVELLDGTNAQFGIEKILADVGREMQQCALLFASEPAYGDSEAGKGFSKALYRWAYCVFSTRSFRPSLVLAAEQRDVLDRVGVRMEDFSVLLPLFDVGNHDMRVEVRWEQRQMETEGQACELKINRTHHPGDQVFNNYGMKTNAELLLGYGFMIPPTEELHNDYIHVRKRAAQSPSTSTSSSSAAAAASGDEYLISRRPMHHPSSLLARSRQALLVKPRPPLGPVLGSFQNVQHDMVWDIFCTLTQREPAPRGTPEEDEERLLQERFFSGQVLQRNEANEDADQDEDEDGSDEEIAHLEQTIAIIQHKILQELERLDETDMHLEPPTPTPTLPPTPTTLLPPPTPTGTGTSMLMPPPTPTIASMLSLTDNQRLALEYRNRCRRVLEETLTAMSGDDGIFDEEDDDESE